MVWEKLRARRSNEDRSSETQRALIQATIEVVYREGYAGTSVATIAEEAGLTRGAVLHHFGNRAGLMAETVRRVYEEGRGQFLDMAAKRTEPFFLREMPGLVWDGACSKSGIAVLDILWSTRNDPQLQRAVMPVSEQIEDDATALYQSNFGGNDEHARAMARILIWSARGLGMNRALSPGSAPPEPEIALLGQMLAMLDPSGPARRSK